MKSCCANCVSAPPPKPAGIRSRLLQRLGHQWAASWMVLVVLAWSPAIAWSQATAPNRPSKIVPRFRENRILIKPKPGALAASLVRFHDRSRARVLHTFGGLGNLQILHLPENETVQAFIRNYEQSGLVEYAEPDYLIRVAVTPPNDPKYLDGTQWGLNNTGQNGGVIDADIDAPEGWDVLTSASNIVVAVLDTGVRYTHEDLAANMWVNPDDGGHGLNTLIGTNDPYDDNGHGTEVAGVLGAVGNNGIGVAGIAWRVQIMACKFIDSAGSGSISDAIACIDYARTNGARIINASWGDYVHSLSVYDAIVSARNAGILFVAAAGNDSRNTDLAPFYPACYELDNVVSVAATTQADVMVDYSNFGVTSVDLAAPGTNIHTTHFLSDNAYATDEGTSMAAPQVAGTLALMLAKYPTETHQQIIGRVLNATDSLPGLSGKCLTGGRLNLQRALNPLVRLTAIPAAGGGPFQLQLSGEPNRAYVILGSSNLMSWSTIYTNFTGTNGKLDFTDTQSLVGSQRFYRAIRSPD